MWETPHVPFDAVPFMTLGRKVFTYHPGKHNNRRKKETRHIIEVSHDRCLGVWCKGICKYDQSFRQEWSVTISRDLMFHGFQGIWREHLADLCGTVRLRSADDVAQSRSLRRGVAFPWRTGGLVFGLIRFVLSVVKYKQLSSYTDYNRICKR